MNYTEHRYTSHDGLSLYYREYGSGEYGSGEYGSGEHGSGEYGSGDDVIVCLPGLTRNSKDFEDLAEHLTGRWRVITPDLRGRGQSDRDPKWKQYLPPTYVRDLWTLLDKLQIEKVVIIGTSLGGLMAMIMADQQPGRLRGVVMNDIGPEVPPTAIARLLEYVGRTPPQADWASAAATTRENYALAYPDADTAFWDHQARLAWRERADGTVEPDYDPKIGDALRHASKAAGLVRFLMRIGVRRLKGINLDPWDNYEAMTMPVLVLRGAISDILTEKTLATMREKKADLVVAQVANRGHAPVLDEPDARHAIDRFLESLSK